MFMSITLNKRTILYLLLVIPFFKTAGQDFSFTEFEHDFGTISVKEKSVIHRFVFENTGTTPLVVKSVYGHCSCIDACWTKQPVQPGDTGSVSVRYSVMGTGTFNKRVKVVTNKKNTFLKVFGEVKK